MKRGVPPPGIFRRHSCCVREIALEGAIDTENGKSLDWLAFANYNQA
ncbi:hypothetical protein BACCAP_02148 [Pseudoflavonifractor capillosus ATCC 29799]|uniref:Uncharacterized protein n=1 Tax=Pseudoflavonifractor capillosus ATCC 29799 TaxID=411467 RepID=A6NVB3_9FIRM|nr:hypothetical protein BACCAP_02148 [Pseudoflavonifractor capillosus ATCC 29799]